MVSRVNVQAPLLGFDSRNELDHKNLYALMIDEASFGVGLFCGPYLTIQKDNLKSFDKMFSIQLLPMPVGHLDNHRQSVDANP